MGAGKSALYSAIAVILGILSVSSTASAQPVKAGTAENSKTFDTKGLEGFFDPVFKKEMKRYHIPGAVLTVVKDGRVVLSKGYGYADMENKTPVRPDKTLFRIGSITKLFTATAAMQQYEKGRIDLKTDVNSYLTGFKLKNRYSRTVTMEQLLTHTSGIDDQRIGDFTKPGLEVKPLTEFLKKHMLPVVTEPGRLIRYSSYEAALAGCIVEETSDMSFDAYVRGNILVPLGMNDTSLETNKEGLAAGYNYINNKLVHKELNGYFNIYPAGGIISTGDDMAKFMLAFLGGGRLGNNRVLREDTLRLMLKQHATFDSRLPGMTYGFNERFVNGKRIAEHEGYSPDGFYSELCLLPEDNAGLFVSINQGGNNYFPEELADEFVKNYFPGKTHISVSGSRQSGADGLNPSGTYRFNEYTRSTFDKCSVFPFGEDARIIANKDGTYTFSHFDFYLNKNITFRLREVEPLVYEKLDSSGFVVFRTGSNGKIEYMAETDSSWHGTYERLKWYQLPAFQIGIFIFFILVSLVGAVHWVIRILKRLAGRKNNETNKWSSYISFLLGADCALIIVFFTGILFSFDANRLIYGVPADGKAFLCIPVLIGFITAMSVILTVKQWKSGIWSFAGKVYYTLLLVSSLTFLWFCNYWNLLGFRY